MNEFPVSSVMYRAGGRSYAMNVVPGCLVCKSPMRILVENSLLKGYSYEAISKSIPSTVRALTPQNIGAHARGKHMPLEEEARRTIIERNATELNLSVVSDDELVDHKTFLRLALRDVVSRMAVREIEPDVKDGIAIAKMLESIDYQEEAHEDLTKYNVALRILMTTAREIMSAKEYQLYSQRLVSNPELAVLMGQKVSGPIEANVLALE